MAEAQEGHAWLEDVTEDTFVRFSQYAYTGDYSVPHPDIVLDASAMATTNASASIETNQFNEVSEVDIDSLDLDRAYDVYDTKYGKYDDWAGSLSKRDKKAVKKLSRLGLYGHFESPESPLWTKFKDRRYPVSVPPYKPDKNFEICEEYSKVFLCHAQLYIFADKYDISELKGLSLHKLHRTLVEFTLFPQRVGDIVDLIRFSYSNTFDSPGRRDQLRDLVVQYAACVTKSLANNAEFLSLLEEPGSLASDLVCQLLERLD
jgi:hypothetical protein